MILIIYFVFLIISLILLVKSSDFFTKYSSKLALSLNINEFLISITLVALGTSLPELSSSIISIYDNSSGYVLGNAIGSTIADLLMLCGLIGIIIGSFKLKWNVIKTDVPLLFSSAILLLLVSIDGTISKIDALFLISGYLIYIYYFISENNKNKSIHKIIGITEEIEGTSKNSSDSNSKNNEDQQLKKISKTNINNSKIKRTTKTRLYYILIITLSIFGIYFGAKYTVESVISISKILKFYNITIIAATIIAIGTTLPELSVSLMASKKKKYDMAIGNIMGSAIFNLLIVIGFSALIKPLKITSLQLTLIIPMLIISIFLFWLSFSNNRFDRAKGLMFILIYALFIVKLLIP
ncbi:MAG: calcium/sodium antiporter [Nitrospiraceae bacterium]|nr:calcium/sodium antiporter [Nitrospiraceae bacterium]